LNSACKIAVRRETERRFAVKEVIISLDNNVSNKNE
jgi:hypothetical protein